MGHMVPRYASAPDYLFLGPESIKKSQKLLQTAARVFFPTARGGT